MRMDVTVAGLTFNVSYDPGTYHGAISGDPRDTDESMWVNNVYIRTGAGRHYLEAEDALEMEKKFEKEIIAAARQEYRRVA